MTYHTLPEKEMHEVFKSQNKFGRPAELETINVLKHLGHDPVDLKKELAENYDERMNFRDSGDILIHVDGKPEIVESKRMRVHFTGSHDFKYKLVIVERVWKFNSKPKQALVYYIWNEDLSHYILVFPAKVKQYFTKGTFPDPYTTQVETAYFIEKKHCIWRKNPCR